MAIYDKNGNEIILSSDFYSVKDNASNIFDIPTTSPSSEDVEGWESSSFAVCDYIEVNPETGFTLFTNELYRPWAGVIYTYDKDKVFLEKVTLSRKTDNSFYLYPYRPSSEVAYIRAQYAAHTVNQSSIFKIYFKVIWSADERLTYTFRDNSKRIRELLGIENIESPFHGKTVLALGDSITENNSHNDNKAWCEYLADIFGALVYNNGKSGTGLIKGYQGYRSICNRVDYGIDGYPNDVTPDIVLIMGNGNDATGGTYYDYSANSVAVTNEYGAHSLPIGNKTDSSSDISVYGATKHLLEALITKYPNSKIGFITSTPRNQDLALFWGEDKANFYGHGAFHDYVEAIKWVCDEYNIPCLDLYHNTLLRPWNETNASTFFADSKIHPNTLGTVEGMVIPIARWMISSF